MGPKRKRSEAAQTPLQPPPMAEDSIQTHKHFKDWAIERGVKIHDGVDAAKLPGRGLGLTVTQPISKETIILFVPEKAMFKPDRRMLKKHSLHDASPQAQLAFCAMLKCHADDSVFALWRKTWPTLADFEKCMLLYWQRQHDTASTSDWDEIMPPTVKAPFGRQLADWEKDIISVRSALSEAQLSEDDFLYYWLIIDSRTFHWKPVKPARASGSLVMCPFIDFLNHGPTGTGCEVLKTPEGYEIVTNKDYTTGEELLISYGAHSYDKLLVHYGFVPSPAIPDRDDSISLDHLIIPALPDNIKQRLQDMGYLGSYVLSPSTNEICFKTEVAVRATLLTCTEWEYFALNGEDLVQDASAEVFRFLEKLVLRWRGEIETKLEIINKRIPSLGEKQSVAILLHRRWLQINDALASYLSANENI